VVPIGPFYVCILYICEVTLLAKYIIIGWIIGILLALAAIAGFTVAMFLLKVG
jgi:hypothetical protein